MSRPRFLKTSYYELCHIWHNPRLPILAALIGTALIVGGATVFTLYHDAFARKAWYQFRAPRMTLVLDFSDAKLASDIGNYYFNCRAYYF